MGGYIFGKFFKGKKLTKISPNKTYSGMLGSFTLSIVLSYLFLWFFEVYFFYPFFFVTFSFGFCKVLIFFNNKRNIVSAINLFINNLNSFKKNIKNLDDKTLRKKLINSKKVRQQILSLKQDIAKPDFGRDQD